MFSCQGGNFDLVKWFFPSDDSELDDDNSYPLISAAKWGTPKVIEFLLWKKWGDLNAQDDSGMTPLMHAYERHHVEAVKFLIQQDGMDINIVSGDEDDNQSSLMIACSGDVPIEITNMLLNHPNIDMNKTGDSKCSPLMVACGAGRFDIAKIFLENQKIKNINGEDRIGTTPFIYACSGGNPDLVKYFLDNIDIDINKVNDHGCTALTNACGEHNLEVVEMLLQRNDIDVGIENPLLACCSGNSDNDNAAQIAKLLLKTFRKDFNIDQGHNYHGRTSLMFACEYRNYELAQLLLKEPSIDINKVEKDYDINAFMLACMSGNIKIVELFLQRSELN